MQIRTFGQGRTRIRREMWAVCMPPPGPIPQDQRSMYAARRRWRQGVVDDGGGVGQGVLGAGAPGAEGAPHDLEVVLAWRPDLGHVLRVDPLRASPLPGEEVMQDQRAMLLMLLRARAVRGGSVGFCASAGCGPSMSCGVVHGLWRVRGLRRLHGLQGLCGLR